MFVGVLSTSILKRIQEKKLIEVSFYNLREFGKGKYHQVDDVPYGGGAGMVMMPEPLSAAIKAAKEKGVKVLLSGMGADEIFFGYRRQRATMMAQRFRRLPGPVKYVIAKTVNLLPVKISGKGFKFGRWAKRF